MHHLILDLFAGMDGNGYALESLQVPIKAKEFFTLFCESDPRMRAVLQHHRVHGQAMLSSVKDSASLPFSNPLGLPFRLQVPAVFEPLP